MGDDDLERVGLTLAKIGPQGVIDLPDLIGGAEGPVVEVTQTEVDDRGGQNSQAHHHGDDDEHGPAHYGARAVLDQNPSAGGRTDRRHTVRELIRGPKRASTAGSTTNAAAPASRTTAMPE